MQGKCVEAPVGDLRTIGFGVTGPKTEINMVSFNNKTWGKSEGFGAKSVLSSPPLLRWGVSALCTRMEESDASHTENAVSAESDPYSAV